MACIEGGGGLLYSEIKKNRPDDGIGTFCVLDKITVGWHLYRLGLG